MSETDLYAWHHWCGALNDGQWSEHSSCIGCRFEVNDPYPGEITTYRLVPTE